MFDKLLDKFGKRQLGSVVLFDLKKKERKKENTFIWTLMIKKKQYLHTKLNLQWHDKQT
jgi:hypothetical protein